VEQDVRTRRRSGWDCEWLYYNSSHLTYSTQLCSTVQKLLFSKSNQITWRRLDDKKRHQLATIYTDTLASMISEDAELGKTGVVISKAGFIARVMFVYC